MSKTTKTTKTTKIVKKEPELRKISVNVKSEKEALGIISKLEQELSKHKDGVGLSAIQIGIPKRVAVIKDGSEFIHIINPEILETSEEFIHFGEGCLSFPGKFTDVPRFKHFIINNNVIDDGKFRVEKQYYYYSLTNHEYEWNGGIQSLAVQHEIDHFDGKLILDHFKKPVVKSEKVGRNDPCPCGSNKKFKKCCGG